MSITVDNIETRRLEDASRLSENLSEIVDGAAKTVRSHRKILTDRFKFEVSSVSSYGRDILRENLSLNELIDRNREKFERYRKLKEGWRR